MKNLILMRHSDTSPYGATDFERKLTEKGVIKAKSMAMKLDSYLENNRLIIDFIFSSSAIRAKETYEFTTCMLQIEDTPKVITQSLYMAGLKELKTLFINYQDEIKNIETLMVIAHNNGISKIASRLSDTSIYFSTANIAILSFDEELSWKKALDFEGNWELEYFIR